MTRGLALYRWWVAVGWLLLVAVIVLSLVRIEQPVSLDQGDKLSHLLAYGVLMYWWGMVQPRRRRFWLLALPVLGIALEWLQSLTPYRYMEWQDALANLAGVLLALLLLATPAQQLLAALDRKLRDRLDPGGA